MGQDERSARAPPAPAAAQSWDVDASIDGPWRRPARAPGGAPGGAKELRAASWPLHSRWQHRRRRPTHCCLCRVARRAPTPSPRSGYGRDKLMHSLSMSVGERGGGGGHARASAAPAPPPLPADAAPSAAPPVAYRTVEDVLNRTEIYRGRHSVVWNATCRATRSPIILKAYLKARRALRRPPRPCPQHCAPPPAAAARRRGGAGGYMPHAGARRAPRRALKGPELRLKGGWGGLACA